jgi:hypothetical protein
MYTVTMPPPFVLHDLLDRVQWPDGLVCPWCGTRERLTSILVNGVPRLRYECTTCDSHRGIIRGY